MAEATVQEIHPLYTKLNLDIFFFCSVGTRRDVSSWERLALTIYSCPLWDAPAGSLGALFDDANAVGDAGSKRFSCHLP